MAEQKTNMTDEQLAQELRKSKGGKLGGKILSLLGGVIAVAGMILGGNLVLVVIGGVVLGLGQMVQGKSKEQAGRQTFDSIAPDIVGTAFENVQMNPVPPLLDANDTNIPLPSHTHCSGSGYIRGTYRGLTTELCTVQADGGQRVPAGGRPACGKRTSRRSTPASGCCAELEPGISHMADHLAAGQTG